MAVILVLSGWDLSSRRKTAYLGSTWTQLAQFLWGFHRSTPVLLNIHVVTMIFITFSLPFAFSLHLRTIDQTVGRCSRSTWIESETNSKITWMIRKRCCMTWWTVQWMLAVRTCIWEMMFCLTQQQSHATHPSVSHWSAHPQKCSSKNSKSFFFFYCW